MARKNEDPFEVLRRAKRDGSGSAGREMRVSGRRKHVNALVDEELAKRFKLFCIERERTQHEVISEALEEYMERAGG